MKKMYGYARVSTKDQNLDRQLIALRDFGIDDRDIIREKASGKSLDREAYQTLRVLSIRIEKKVNYFYEVTTSD